MRDIDDRVILRITSRHKKAKNNAKEVVHIAILVEVKVVHSSCEVNDVFDEAGKGGETVSLLG